MGQRLNVAAHALPHCRHASGEIHLRTRHFVLRNAAKLPTFQCEIICTMLAGSINREVNTVRTPRSYYHLPRCQATAHHKGKRGAPGEHMEHRDERENNLRQTPLPPAAEFIQFERITRNMAGIAPRNLSDTADRLVSPPAYASKLNTQRRRRSCELCPAANTWIGGCRTLL